MSTSTGHPAPEWTLWVVILAAVIVAAVLAGIATSVQTTTAGVIVAPTPLEVAVILAGMLIGGIAALFALLLAPL